MNTNTAQPENATDIPVPKVPSNTGNTNKKSYASLFKDNRVPNDSSMLNYIQQPVEDIRLELDEIESVEETHGFCFVGYVYGSRPGPYTFVNFVKGWGNNVKLQFKENGWIRFQFPTAEDRDRVMRGGPYMILGRQLFLKELPSCFLYRKEEMMLLPSWVQILGLPAECWTTKALSKIASTVGRPLYTDKMTSLKKGSNYARVLVELDAKQARVREQVVTLPNGASISINFKYELDPKVCDQCNSLGHLSDMCGVKETRKRYKQKPPTRAADFEHIHKKDQTSQELNPEGQVFSQNTYMPNINIEDHHQAINVPDMTLHSGSQHCMEDGLNKKNTSPNHIPQHNNHIYFEDEVKSYNSEPYENVSDFDDCRTMGFDDSLFFRDLQDKDEWITVTKKHRHNRRNKAKYYTLEIKRPLTRSNSLLLQQTSHEVRLPITAFVDQ